MEVQNQTNQSNFSIKPVLTEKQEAVYTLHQQGLTQSKIAKKLNLSIGYTNRILFYCRKKGFEVKKFYPNRKQLEEIKSLRERVIQDLKEKLKWPVEDLEKYKEEIYNLSKEKLQELLEDINKKASKGI